MKAQSKWPTRRLADCGEWVSGGTPSKAVAAYWNGDIPWISSKSLKTFDLSDSEDRITEAAVENGTTLVPAGTVMFVVRGMSLANEFRVGVTTRPVAFNQDLRAIIPASDIDGRFLTHYLKATEQVIMGMANNATHGTKRLPTELIESIHVPVPPLPEQRRIAAILDNADAIRRKREDGIRLTEELLRSTFLELFGDPATNPEDWPIRSMADVVEETQYGTAAKSNGDGEGLPVLRMNNITYGGEIDLSDLKWCEISEEGRPQYTVRKGDLLFNRTNSPELVGKTAVWERDDTYAFAGYLVRVRFHENQALPDYVSAFLNSAYGKKMLFAKAKPSNNMSNFSAGEFCRIELPVPGIDIQRRFQAVVGDVRDMKEKRVAGLAEASNLFGSLVQRAFRGEL
jgi:type I restriction enzyme S subunit